MSHHDDPAFEGDELDQAELAVLASELLRLLADPTRLRVAWLLAEREWSVGELARELGRNPASVSQHLAKMRIARVVTTRRDGTSVHYRIDDEHLAHLLTELHNQAEHMATPTPPQHRQG